MLYPIISRRPIVTNGGFRTTLDFDTVFDRFFKGEVANGISAAWSPAVDISEADEAYAVRIELPGLNPEQVEVTIEKGILSVSGEKAEVVGDDSVERHLVECRTGSFNRTFKLPDVVDSDAVDGKFKNGVLELNLPKVAQAKPRKIKIELN